MTDGEGGDVVGLRLVQGDAPMHREDRQPFCAHDHVLLRSEARRVVCDDCGREVDAFGVLERLSANWERYADFADSHRREAGRTARVLEDLQRQVRNEKAKLRRARRRGEG